MGGAAFAGGGEGVEEREASVAAFVRTRLESDSGAVFLPGFDWVSAAFSRTQPRAKGTGGAREMGEGVTAGGFAGGPVPVELRQGGVAGLDVLKAWFEFQFQLSDPRLGRSGWRPKASVMQAAVDSFWAIPPRFRMFMN